MKWSIDSKDKTIRAVIITEDIGPHWRADCVLRMSRNADGSGHRKKTVSAIAIDERDALFRLGIALQEVEREAPGKHSWNDYIGQLGAKLPLWIGKMLNKEQDKSNQGDDR